MFSVIGILSCGSTKKNTSKISSNQKEWELIWEDSFEKEDFLDPEKWNVIERNTADWGNYMSDY